jgi:hypothetical protein
MATAKSNNMDSAVEFLTDLKRLSAISSYLSSFVDGIDCLYQANGFLHVSHPAHHKYR